MRWFLFILVVAAVAVGVWYQRQSGEVSAPEPRPEEAIAVIAAEVTQSDVPIWLSGIGSARAYNSVTIRPRVSGTLERVEFHEGAMVKAGDVLAQIDERPYQAVLSQAEARKTQNEAQLTNARQDLVRMETLVQSRAESRQSLDQAAATVAQLEAAVEADTAAIEAARLNLEFTTLRSPISGRTGIRLLDVGNLVTANQEEGLVMITQLQPISVVFTLPQQNLAALRPYMKPGEHSLVVQAIGEDGTLLEEGALELIDNRIDAATGTLRLKANFANEDLSLWPGQFLTARLLVETRPDRTVVPAEAVQPGLDGPFAYLINADSRVEVRPVKPGLTLNGWTIIEEGLHPGEQVVRDGHTKLKPGALVKMVNEATGGEQT